MHSIHVCLVCRCTSLYITRMYVDKVRTISDKFGQIQTSLDQFQQDFQKDSYLIKLMDVCLQKFVKTRQCTVLIHVCRCTSVYATLTASVSASATSFVYPMFGSKNSSKRRPGFVFSWFVCKYLCSPCTLHKL